MSRLLAQLTPGGGAGGTGSSTTDSILGTVSPPPGVSDYNQALGADGIGIILFISNMIRIATIIAGIWVLFNFITAGFDYITAGDSKASQKVKDKLTASIIGLVIIVASYVIIGILGQILFGDATFFLNPRICGPGVQC